jgi:hypothetical protein
MYKNMYFITPNYSVAMNLKCASSTLARSIIQKFHPNDEFSIQNAAYPNGKNPDDIQWHFLCPKEKDPSKEVLLVVRNPANRFISAMSQFDLSNVDEVLYALENKTSIMMKKRQLKVSENNHFTNQINKIITEALCYKMEDLNLAATEIGLDLPLPTINESSGPRPELTEEQTQRVLNYYAEDLALYNSIPNGGGWISK